MKKLLLLIGLYSIISQAQTNDSSNTYQIIDTTYTLVSKANQQKLLISIISIYDNIKHKGEFWYREYLVKVLDLDDKLLQTFSNDYTLDIYSDDFRLEDINFDNKEDLWIKIGENPFNRSYEFWRYDTITSSFSYDSLFSGIISFNPSFDNEKKEIETGAGFPDWTYWEETYSYDGHNLELIMEDYQEKLAPLPNDKYQFIYKRVKKIRQGDKMVVEKEVTGTIEEIGMGWEDR